MPRECPACPSCQSVEGVLPISRIYIAGITRPPHRTEADWAVLNAVFGSRFTLTEGLDKRFHLFEPPGTAPDKPRPLHPDMAALIAAIFLLVLVGNVFEANRQLWTAPLWLGAGLGVIYLLFRQRLMKDYRSALVTYHSDWQSLANDMARWRRVYFCPRDEVLFEISEDAAQPLASRGAKGSGKNPSGLLDWVKGRR